MGRGWRGDRAQELPASSFLLPDLSPSSQTPLTWSRAGRPGRCPGRSVQVGTAHSLQQSQQAPLISCPSGAPGRSSHAPRNPSLPMCRPRGPDPGAPPQALPGPLGGWREHARAAFLSRGFQGLSPTRRPLTNSTLVAEAVLGLRARPAAAHGVCRVCASLLDLTSTSWESSAVDAVGAGGAGAQGRGAGRGPRPRIRCRPFQAGSPRLAPSPGCRVPRASRPGSPTAFLPSSQPAGDSRRRPPPSHVEPAPHPRGRPGLLVGPQAEQSPRGSAWQGEAGPGHRTRLTLVALGAGFAGLVVHCLVVEAGLAPAALGFLSVGAAPLHPITCTGAGIRTQRWPSL